MKRFLGLLMGIIMISSFSGCDSVDKSGAVSYSTQGNNKTAMTQLAFVEFSQSVNG